MPEQAQPTLYMHHDRPVWVRPDLKGRHREHCLCYQCDKFTPTDRAGNCRIASLLDAVCVAFGVTTPVWECAEYAERR